MKQPFQFALVSLVGALMCAPSLAPAFSLRVHDQITKNTLKTVSAPIGGTPRSFTEQSLEDISQANQAVDSLVAIPATAAIFAPANHATNDSVEGSSQRLVNLKKEIIDALKQSPPDGKTARDKLGKALHTVQDFYSHSTWVNVNGGIETRLGREVIRATGISATPCAADPNVLSTPPGFSTGYFVDTDPKTGALKHRDTYGCARVAPWVAGKCFHGNYRPTCIGINKDLDAVGADEEGVTVSPHHGAAVTTAELATKDYTQQIIDAFPGPGGEPALAALFNLRGDVGFVVDDTGSMSTDIAGVRLAISGIVSFINASPDFLNLKPDRWLLTRFGDPDVGPTFTTLQAEELLARARSLFASGGGDCPELSQKGLRMTLEAAGDNSRLFLFTDATAKDSALANEVIALAQRKHVNISYFITGSCSPIDPAYIRGAQETGGQLFLINRGEVGNVLQLITPRFVPSVVRLYSDNAAMPASQTRWASIPVDSTITRLMVNVSLTTKSSISLQRPDGSAVAAGQPGVTVSELSTGKLVVIEAPAPGTWKVTLVGAGDSSVVADAASPIAFHTFNFVANTGDIHGGFSPIDGQPVLGSSPIADAFLIGSVNNPTFKFIDDAGNPLGEMPLSLNYPKAAENHYMGNVSPPATSFRVALQGTDANGFAVSRVYPTVYRPQPVSVTVEGNSGTAQVGTVTPLDFTIRNVGAPTTWNIVASVDGGASVTVSPTSVGPLATGASSKVRVLLNLPASVPPGVVLNIAVTATSAADSTRYNSGTAKALTFVPVVGDVNRDGMVDCQDIAYMRAAFGKRRGSDSFDVLADLNGDGVVDVRDLVIVTKNLPAGSTCR